MATPHVHAKILLPDGTKPVKNNVPWKGAVSPGQFYTTSATFTAPAGTEFRITGSVYAMRDDGSIAFGQRAIVHAHLRNGVYYQDSDDTHPVLDPETTAMLSRGPDPNGHKSTALLERPRKSMHRLQVPSEVPEVNYNSELQGDLLGAAAIVTAGQHLQYRRFYARAGDSVHIRGWAHQFDAYLRLYDPRGVLVAENDDAEDLDPRIPERGELELASSGYYTVEISGEPRAGGSAYRLLVARSGTVASVGGQLRPRVIRPDQLAIRWQSTTDRGGNYFLGPLEKGERQ